MITSGLGCEPSSDGQGAPAGRRLPGGNNYTHSLVTLRAPFSNVALHAASLDKKYFAS
jgi:hypothetical protein